MQERHVKNEKKLRNVRKKGEFVRDRLEHIERRERGSKGGLKREKVGNFLANLGGRLLQKDIVNQDLIDLGASGHCQRHQSAIWEMAAAPKVDRSRIPVV